MYSVVITAAGIGSRAGLGYNKLLFEVGGRTVLENTVRIFATNKLFNQIIVTTNEDDKKQYENILKDYDVLLITGGSERMHSVAKGVSQAKSEYVFVHDGARMFLKDELIRRLADYHQKYDGLALAVNATDTTLKVNNGRVIEVLDRNQLFNMQTPQVVNKAIYLQAYNLAVADSLLFTDEVSMLCHYGYECKITLSETTNTKLTKPEDFKELDV